MAGSVGEPTAFLAEALSDPDRTRGWDMFTTFVPGINPVAVEGLHPTARLAGLFPHPGSGRERRRTRGEVLPVTYAGFIRAIRSGQGIDTLVLHVAPPDSDGNCSLGPMVEFFPELLKQDRRILAVVNDRIPAFDGTLSVPASRIEAYCESDDPLREYAAGDIDPVSLNIAERSASFIEDGTTLQVGIGKAPVALLGQLGGRRGLRLHSGLATEGVVSLLEQGILAPDCPSLSTALLGTSGFYDWLRTNPPLKVRGCDVTHDPVRLAQLPRFVAINSALEVDLHGQANLERAGSRLVSATGGSLDFAHAASLAPGGCSIVILAATGPGGRSRIVPRLGEAALVTLPRTCIDVVITEHGIADLRGLCGKGRAEAIAAVADPAARADLAIHLDQFD